MATVPASNAALWIFRGRREKECAAELAREKRLAMRASRGYSPHEPVHGAAGS